MTAAFDSGFRFTVMAGNKRVAVIAAEDRLMLDAFVDGELDEGKRFREELIRRDLWHPSMPLTVRLADGIEADTFDMAGMDENDPSGGIADDFVYWIDEADFTFSPFVLSEWFPDNPEIIEKVEGMARTMRQRRAAVLRSQIKAVRN